MKTAGIVLVVAVALYAVYDLFKGNLGIGAAATTPGTLSRAGVSVPGVPSYETQLTTVANSAATSMLSQVSPTDFVDTLGSNNDGDDSFEVSSSDVSGDDASLDFD